MLAQAQEGLSSVRMVHAFGREEWEVRQFHGQAHASLQANLRLTLTNVNSALVISTLMVVGTAAMYYIGTQHVLDGTLTLGSLLVFSAYLLMLYQPLESLTYTAWAMEGAAAGAQRCFEVLDRADDVLDAPDAADHSPDVRRDRLRRRRLRLRAGPTDPARRRSAASRRTRSSRSSAAPAPEKARSSALSRASTIRPRGRVTLDGRDLRELTKKSLRAQIGIVLQDTLLFSTTIRENIAYGRPDATEAEIREAAQRAPRRMTSSAGCRRATTAPSANAADTSASASGNASASRAPF